MSYRSDLYQKTALVLKALAHPIRLCIVHGLLKKGPCNVSCMENCIKASQSGISQHLARLRSAGIVKSERCGNEIYYEIASEDIKDLIVSIFNEDE
ncbi:MAG: metalloregulator ArsR/SmtB family transcription factor [Tepidanaerobacteraceae bacterium]|nr:metalloregulator ArsR/SmtB family transcription factor [Tepidanaerobacteraceae bacterium]